VLDQFYLGLLGAHHEQLPVLSAARDHLVCIMGGVLLWLRLTALTKPRW
jgi:hypothetical protein